MKTTWNTTTSMSNRSKRYVKTRLNDTYLVKNKQMQLLDWTTLLTCHSVSELCLIKPNAIKQCYLVRWLHILKCKNSEIFFRLCDLIFWINCASGTRLHDRLCTCDPIPWHWCRRGTVFWRGIGIYTQRLWKVFVYITLFIANIELVCYSKPVSCMLENITCA